MPELPEVETIRLGLKNLIIGKKIAAIDIGDSKVWQADKTKIIGHKVKDIRRRAKTLLIDFNNDQSLFIHLKMTGQLIYRRQLAAGSPQRLSADSEQRTANSFAGGHPSSDFWAKLPNAYTRVVFEFSDGSHLYFNDLRKFAWIKGGITRDLEALQEKEYGPEPFSDKFNQEYLYRVIANKPKQNIKKILTDQTLIAGIGNIYADESLFYAHILPTRLGGTLKKEEINKLFESIVKALQLGLKYHGSSENTYVDATGQRGEMQKHFQVYGRGGQDCVIDGCQGKVKKIRLNGRGTHFCQGCQE